MATRRDEAETRKRSRREPNLQNIKSNRVETELQASRFRSLIYAPLERERKERKEERERERRKEKIRSMKIFIRALRATITGILQKLNFIFYRLLGPEHTTAEY